MERIPTYDQVHAAQEPAHEPHQIVNVNLAAVEARGTSGPHPGLVRRMHSSIEDRLPHPHMPAHMPHLVRAVRSELARRRRHAT